MGFGNFIKAAALTSALSAGCTPDTTNMTCEEIKERIALEQAPDRYPAANVDGAIARQAGREFRRKILEAAAVDKECDHSSPKRD